MRRKIGMVCMFLGVSLLCGALSLYLHNRGEDSQARQHTQVILPQLLEQVPTQPEEAALARQLIPVEFLEESAFEMTEVMIDGYGYIGFLGIPGLELNLPVMGDWDDSRLQIAPCRYHGSVNGENLVLMAHNYSTHFGRLSELKAGDRVTFTDMDGITTGYQVVALDILPPDAVEEMTAGDFDLTLFTCTYGGKSRVTVYCDQT